MRFRFKQLFGLTIFLIALVFAAPAKAQTACGTPYQYAGGESSGGAPPYSSGVPYTVGVYYRTTCVNNTLVKNLERAGQFSPPGFHTCADIEETCMVTLLEASPEEIGKSALPDEVSGVLGDFRYCNQVPAGPQRDACVSCASDESGDKVYTAVGCINTSGEALAGDLIRLFLGVSGGIALLSILGAAFIFSTSQGDTNKVKKAKELMTAAVSGLFFIIFSVIILNFIGVEILKIPGLG